MAAWVFITIAAAFLQNARSALQKRLKGRLGGAGATYVRFLYGLPFACAFALAATLIAGGPPTPIEAPPFLGFVALGGAAQILATFALLRSFDFASFAVGTAFSKTEPVLAALFGAALLAEIPSAGAAGAIALGVLGVGLAALRPDATGRLGLEGRAIAWGVGAAALFGISAVSYRAASVGLGEHPAWLRATTTLAAATLFQTVAMGLWMRAYALAELRAVVAAWRSGLWVGAAGAAASAAWFTAFTLEPAAHVRALGNIELIFTVAASVLLFGERPTARELLGAALTVVSVAALLLATV